MYLFKLFKIISLAGLVLVTNTYNSSAQEIDELMDMPLKDLMNMEVTSVSKKAEKATDAAAAIYVITQEDIKHSGVTNIPEALRMAPGIQVSRISASQWAITSRGFAGDFANKLLVLIDGRSVYNPLFSGVLWEEQGTPIEDIERIEIIRGPGSTLWGANAVNGVINIITKSSKDTQGTLVAAGVGTFENFSGLARHGGKVGENSTYRAYIQNYNHGSTDGLNGKERHDDWKISRTGFRSDGQASDTANYTVQGDLYKGKRNEQFDALPSLTGPFADPVLGLYTIAPDEHDISGGNVLARYNKKLDNNSDLSVQMYYDYTQRKVDIFSQKIHTVDIDAQHSFNLSENHDLIWGVGYRIIWDKLEDTLIARYDDSEIEETKQLFSGFVQDKIQLMPDELYLTLGSKFEHNDYTGFEIQPNARLTWLAADNQTVWGAVSRAVRTPSRNDETFTQIALAFPTGGAPPTAFAAISGNEEFDSEKMIAYEIGYRVQPTYNTSLDLTAFVNDYDNLRTFEASGALAPDIGLNYLLDNKAQGQTKGIEVAANWEVTDRWSLTGGYTYLQIDIKLDSDSTDILSEADEDRSPTNMFNIRSHYKIDNEWQINNALYYVDEIKAANVDSYIRFDANIIWEPTDGVELSLVGQNLFDNRHQEFAGATYNTPSEIPRSVFGKVTFRF